MAIWINEQKYNYILINMQLDNKSSIQGEVKGKWVHL